ncbi:MAG TPA: hypothetical protein VMT44_02930 [Methanoregula sp.]|nr:hypothetical protein [Methanoregula sp.]
MTVSVCCAGRAGRVRFDTFCAPAPGPKDLLSLVLQIARGQYRRNL